MEMLTKCPLVSHRIILMPHPKQQQAARNCSRQVSDLSVHNEDKQGTTNQWQWNSINNYKTPDNGNEGKVHVDEQGNSSPIFRKRQKPSLQEDEECWHKPVEDERGWVGEQEVGDVGDVGDVDNDREAEGKCSCHLR